MDSPSSMTSPPPRPLSQVRHNAAQPWQLVDLLLLHNNLRQRQSIPSPRRHYQNLDKIFVDIVSGVVVAIGAPTCRGTTLISPLAKVEGRYVLHLG